MGGWNENCWKSCRVRLNARLRFVGFALLGDDKDGAPAADDPLAGGGRVAPRPHRKVQPLAEVGHRRGAVPDAQLHVVQGGAPPRHSPFRPNIL